MDGWVDGCSPSSAFQGFKVVSKWFQNGFKEVSNTFLVVLSILKFRK